MFLIGLIDSSEDKSSAYTYKCNMHITTEFDVFNVRYALKTSPSECYQGTVVI